jgi:hypothetical protein
VAAWLVAAPVAMGENPACDEYCLNLPDPEGDNPPAEEDQDKDPAVPAPTDTAPPTAPDPAPTPVPAPVVEAPVPSASDNDRDRRDRREASTRGADRGHEPALVASSTSDRPIPEIAADAAGDGWVPLLLLGLAGITATGVLAAYRRRRTGLGERT